MREAGGEYVVPRPQSVHTNSVPQFERTPPSVASLLPVVPPSSPLILPLQLLRSAPSAASGSILSTSLYAVAIIQREINILPYYFQTLVYIWILRPSCERTMAMYSHSYSATFRHRPDVSILDHEICANTSLHLHCTQCAWCEFIMTFEC